MTRYLCFLTLVLTVATHGALAAELSYTRDRVMGCYVSLDGQIENGDVEKFKPFLAAALQSFRKLPTYDSNPGHPDAVYSQRICLNSPGGSLPEGIRIAKLIYGEWGTAVARGKTCESACSVVFMAGSRSPEDDRGIIADRTIHPLARLGFHAPSLGIAEGSYSADVVSKAYAVALAGMGQLYDIAGFIKFPASLIGEMIATPPDQMMYIDTIGQAARWYIGVGPTVSPSGMPALAVINTCNNHYLFGVEAISLNGFYSRDHKVQYNYFPSVEKDEYGYNGKLEGFGQEAASECDVTSYHTSPALGDRPVVRVGWVSIGDEVGAEFLPSKMFGPSTPIVTLARQNDLNIEAVDIHDLSTDARVTTGRCMVFSGSKVTDNDPCTQSKEARFRSKEYFVMNHIWPSGGKTVIEAFEGVYKINGAETEIEFVRRWENEDPIGRVMNQQAALDKAVDWHSNCWRNPASGNLFCYQKYYDQDYRMRGLD